MQAKIVIVTGALKGIGFEIARQLKAMDYRVVITGRDAVRGNIARQKFSQMGFDIEFRVLDVASTQSIEKFAQAALNDFGRIDVLINNAGILIDVPYPTTLSEYASVIERTFITNALGPYLLCSALVPHMVDHDYGRVVNVTSGMGQLSEMNGGYPGYRMSKTALNAVTRMFADETRGKNVLVNSVCPGWVKTDMGGNGAPRSVERGAETIVWLATLPDGAPTGGFFRDKKSIAW